MWNYPVFTCIEDQIKLYLLEYFSFQTKEGQRSYKMDKNFIKLYRISLKQTIELKHETKTAWNIWHGTSLQRRLWSFAEFVIQSILKKKINRW